MRLAWWRACVFVSVSSFPMYWGCQAWRSALGPDPGKVLVDNLGLGALVLLLLTLSMSPLSKLTEWSGWVAVRRQLGLWVFAFASLHMASYLVFVLGFDLGRLVGELRERPYILLGAGAYIGLLLLAATSTRRSMRLLGKRWKRLHRTVYLILPVVLVHMLWVVRSDLAQWLGYALVAACLLGLRIPSVERSFLMRHRTKR